MHQWFIRPDGGDRKQCTGEVDAPYHGKGTMQPCAFRHPYYLFTNDEYNNKHWVVEGGDTILIHGGPYRMGYKGPAARDYWGSCPGDPFGCTMPPIPSGTPGHPTRLLGEDHGACKQKTQLYGGYGLGTVINLAGAKNVEIECLELTDHTQCTRVGAGYPASEGCNSSFPLDDYSSVGIGTNTETANITLRDLYIHGFTSRGIIGAIGGEIDVERVRIAFNGAAGWDFDDGKGTKSSPSAWVKASYLTVEWNGCNEEYPIRHEVPAHNCFDQDHGGYGDGIGTPDTTLNFTCNHCIIRYNTQDGFDLLHASGSTIAISNSMAYGNMGQQWKIGAMREVRFQNNLTVNNCKRLSAPVKDAPADYNRYLSLFCRAGGDGITFVVTDGGKYIFQSNSFAGYGATSYDIQCSGTCSTASIIFQNNLNIGIKSPYDGRPPGIFYLGENVPRGTLLENHNIYYNMRTCPVGHAERCVDPKIAYLPQWKGEESLDGIDFHLTSESPARGAGVSVGIDTDHDGMLRSGSSVDIGAFQYRH
ncbi:MAG: hypothetical protein FWD64_03185 [Acidobacteriaceae bacterium]|nr:hypothetical protein [Acidobacteriaceae bacterium]